MHDHFHPRPIFYGNQIYKSFVIRFLCFDPNNWHGVCEVLPGCLLFGPPPTTTKTTNAMLQLAITLIIIAIIAAVLGLGGIADFALNIAWIVGIIGIILFIVHAVSSRKS